MEKKGVFLIKGSIDKVKEKMNISKVTVYSYLDEIKNGKLITKRGYTMTIFTQN